MNICITVPEDLGRRLIRGVCKEIAPWIIGRLAGVGAVQPLFPTWDDTDDRSAGIHSEMRLRTDHMTRCQYLESSNGALTPRLGADGKQVCRP